jgi:hypothetical protein
MKRYALLDQEDTGFSDDGTPIPQQTIEIAALIVSYPALEVERVYYARFRPTIPVLPAAAKVNGYTPETWELYPELNAYDLDHLADMLDGTQVVGSMPSYDDRILTAERARVGGREPRLATHRRLDLGSIGAPLVEALGLKSGGMDAIIGGLESIGLLVPPTPTYIQHASRGRTGPHTAMGDAWRLLHVMRHVYLPAVEHWQRKAA